MSKSYHMQTYHSMLSANNSGTDRNKQRGINKQSHRSCTLPLSVAQSHMKKMAFMVFTSVFRPQAAGGGGGHTKHTLNVRVIT